VTSSWTRCSTCGFDLHHPICELPASVLGLYDDDRFPGRCILVYKEHREEFESLDPAEVQKFMQDVQRAARAIRAATGADRMNFAVLGNAVPHLHAHLIPRIHEGDPVPNKSPWNHPDPAGSLEPTVREQLMRAIQVELDTQGG